MADPMEVYERIKEISPQAKAEAEAFIKSLTTKYTSKNPATNEICNNNLDDDCDGNTDEGCEVVCTTVYDPVCGVNGITYSNSCLAQKAGVGIAHTGACSTIPSSINIDAISPEEAKIFMTNVALQFTLEIKTNIALDLGQCKYALKKDRYVNVYEIFKENIDDMVKGMKNFYYKLNNKDWKLCSECEKAIKIWEEQQKIVQAICLVEKHKID